MAYQENTIKNAEAKFTILKKKLREIEEKSRRWERMLRESLAARQRLKEEIEGLKLFLVMAGTRSSKSDSR